MSRVVIGAALVSLIALTTAHAQSDIINRAQAADNAKNYAEAVQLWTQVTQLKDPPTPPRMAPYNPAFAQALANSENTRVIGHYELGVHYELGLGVRQNWQSAVMQYRWAMTTSPSPHPDDYYRAVLRDIVIYYNGYGGQKSTQSAMTLTQYLKDKPELQQETQILIQHGRIPAKFEQLATAWDQYQKDSKAQVAQEAQKQAQQERGERNDDVVVLRCAYSTDNSVGTVVLDLTKRRVVDMELGEDGKNIPFTTAGHLISWSQTLHYTLNRQTMVLESRPFGWPWHCQLQHGF